MAIDLKTIVQKMAQEAAVIILNGDAYRIGYCDDEDEDTGIYAIDEETQDETFIAYSEIDLKRDTFYKLVAMDAEEYIKAGELS